MLLVQFWLPGPLVPLLGSMTIPFLRSVKQMKYSFVVPWTLVQWKNQLFVVLFVNGGSLYANTSAWAGAAMPRRTAVTATRAGHERIDLSMRRSGGSRALPARACRS